MAEQLDIHSVAREDVERAVAFYEQFPDGQYDEIAAAALRYILKCHESAELFSDPW